MPGNGKKIRLSLSGVFMADPPSAQESPFWIYVIPLLLFTFIISICHIRTLDLWWHLKTGEWIIQNRAIPHQDVFSYTAAGKPWISHEWLFGLIAFGTYRLGGEAGIILGKALLVTLLMGLGAGLAKIRRVRPGIAVLLLAAAYAASRMRLFERPELFSLALALAFLLFYEKSNSRPAALAALPALQLLWVNLHGGTALLGWVLAGTLLFDRIWTLKQASGRLSNIEAGRLFPHLAAFSGVLLVSFLNPHGHKALFYGLLRTESPLDNKEFQSLARMILGGVDLSIVIFILFAVILALTLTLNPKRARLYEWFLFPFLLVLTVVFFRFRPLFLFLLAPSLACLLLELPCIRKIRNWCFVASAMLLLGRVAQMESRTSYYQFGIGIHSGLFDEKAIRFIRDTGIQGNMFNSYGNGGYLIWRLGPDRKVFIDGREDVYLGPGVLHEYVHAFDSRRNWHNLVGKYGIDYAVLSYPESPPIKAEDSLDSLAFPRSEWALVYYDDWITIYIRRNGKNDAVLGREIKLIQPLQLSTYLDDLVRDPRKLALFQNEIVANAAENPTSFRNEFTLGLLAMKSGSGNIAEALLHFGQAAAINPDFAPAHTNVGTIYLALGRFAEAREAFERSLAIEPNSFVRSQMAKIP